MLDPRALARPFRYRVVVSDAEGWPVIPGRLGQIECHDGQALVVHSTRPRVFARLWAVPGVQRWQTGALEMRALFPPERLVEIATGIGARRKRRLDPETARNLGTRTAYRRTSAP